MPACTRTEKIPRTRGRKIFYRIARSSVSREVSTVYIVVHIRVGGARASRKRKCKFDLRAYEYLPYYTDSGQRARRPEKRAVFTYAVCIHIYTAAEWKMEWKMHCARLWASDLSTGIPRRGKEERKRSLHGGSKELWGCSNGSGFAFSEDKWMCVDLVRWKDT